MKIKWQDYYARRTNRITGSQIRQFFALTERPEIISFAGGFPDNEFFPREDLSRALATLVKEDSRQSLQYGPTEGIYELRVYLSGKMRRAGADCEIDNIIITNGSQQGIDLLSRALINPGDPVLVEEPAYIGGMGAIKSYGGVPFGIKMDEAGPLPDSMIETIEKLLIKGLKPKFFYTVPNFQNPTGVTTSLERRFKILKIASQYNMIVIEDDPYGELCYDGIVPPSYYTLDREQRVVFLGSYSKVLIPGIRIGWMAGAGELLEKITLIKQTTDLCSSSIGQRLAYRLSHDGYIERHIERLKTLYRQKRNAMFEAMKQFFPPSVNFSRPGGGFFSWVSFPDYYPISRELLNMALERKVAFVHGKGFYNNGGGGAYTARFSFSQPGLDDINYGIRIFGDLLWEIETKQRNNCPAVNL
jgi:2-aminoadipate transaminase